MRSSILNAISRWLLAAGMGTHAVAGSAANATEVVVDRDDTTTLRTHEPTLLGWTYDDSGDGYMDFTLSAKFPLFPNWIRNCISENTSLNFAFTGRFGQYFNRESSPVIGKRFNPELFFHVNLGRSAYIDLGYAHESNGQQINSLASYQQAQLTLERPEYADDYISRGWDYVRFTLRSPPYPGFRDRNRLQAYFTAKYFLEDGVLQGPPEEYNAWENNPEGKPRNEVDGLSVLLKYVHDSANDDKRVFSDWKLALVYTTGYREIFRYNSVRFEVGIKFFQLPVIFWASRGYNSDLVRYYKDVHAAGFAVEIGTF